MSSHEYLLKEVEEKLVNFQSLLYVCETEKCRLEGNLTSVKQAVDESFKRHIGTLQCRAKWLACHVDSIFHLKEGSLAQQIAELELICGELKSCLEASDCTLNRSDEIRMMANNVLQNAESISPRPCESSTLSFLAHDEKMEEMIIMFGDIDDNSSSVDQTGDYDLLSDEGIYVVNDNRVVKKHDPIEMEVKSIEMHHLTAQSAKSEKEDFERIEIEMQPLLKVEEDPVVLSQSDSAYEEGSDSSKSCEWLHRPTTTTVEESKTTEVETSQQMLDVSSAAEEIPPVESTAVSASTTDKVPLWLIDCEESNPWIRGSCSNNARKALAELPLKEVKPSEDIMPSEDIKPVASKDLEILPSEDINPLVEMKDEVVLEETPATINSWLNGTFDHFDSIRHSCDSTFLRGDMVNTKENSFTLDTAIKSLALFDNQPLQKHPSEGNRRMESVFGHFNEIFKSSDARFLRGRQTLDRSLCTAEVSSSDADLERSVYLANSVMESMGSEFEELSKPSDIESEFSMDTTTPYSHKSNLEHLHRIVDTPHSNFLMSQDMKVSQLLTGTYIKQTAAVDHMRMLQKRPDHVFLQSSSGKRSLPVTHDMCEWLRGTSADRCMECRDVDTCAYSDKFDGKWIKTATDW